jgi:hypothetical protein
MTRLRLTRRGQLVVAWALALGLVLAPGFAEMLGYLATGAR